MINKTFICVKNIKGSPFIMNKEYEVVDTLAKTDFIVVGDWDDSDESYSKFISRRAMNKCVHKHRSLVEDKRIKPKSMFHLKLTGKLPQ